MRLCSQGLVEMAIHCNNVFDVIVSFSSFLKVKMLQSVNFVVVW